MCLKAIINGINSIDAINPQISTKSLYFHSSDHREVSERLKEHAWNACVGQLTEGSNPFLSAILDRKSVV